MECQLLTASQQCQSNVCCLCAEMQAAAAGGFTTSPGRKDRMLDAQLLAALLDQPCLDLVAGSLQDLTYLEAVLSLLDTESSPPAAAPEQAPALAPAPTPSSLAAEAPSKSSAPGPGYSTARCQSIELKSADDHGCHALLQSEVYAGALSGISTYLQWAALDACARHNQSSTSQHFSLHGCRPQALLPACRPAPMPTVKGPIVSSRTIVPIVIQFPAPYEAPACAPGCILSLADMAGAGSASFDPTEAGYGESRTTIFIASDDKMTYTTHALVSCTTHACCFPGSQHG